jgi:hypothetical protein
MTKETIKAAIETLDNLKRLLETDLVDQEASEKVAMEDNDVIKALKEILEIMLCEGDLQRSATVSKALDLINRQKAEIDRFSRAIHNMSITTEVQMRAENEFQWLQINRVKQARAEAITEFAERLKQYTECMGECTVDNPLMETHSVVREKYIDQIAKEMKGEQ